MTLVRSARFLQTNDGAATRMSDCFRVEAKSTRRSQKLVKAAMRIATILRLLINKITKEISHAGMVIN